MRGRLIAVIAAALAGVAGWIFVSHDAGRAARANPEDGKVAHGRYTNAYFDIGYPLPSGWGKAVAGPGPSESGYYVLETLVPAGQQNAIILIAAQDRFFSDKVFDDASAMAADFSRTVSGIEGMTIDRERSEARLGGRVFSRVDFSGVGLHRTMFVTDIRCHFVSFNLTANSPEFLASVADSLNGLSFAAGEAATTSRPVCIRNYAVAENLLRRVEPVALGPRFAPIPVRIIVGTDGRVTHVHVIRAAAAQRKSIEDALGQWMFRPPAIDGRAVEVETGLLFKFGRADAGR